METANLDIVTEKVEGKREIVDQMVRRYLLHARDNQSERAKLYGLAMLRRADQSIAIAELLGLTFEQAKTSFASELNYLHRRYSFIFTEKDEPLLHQEVREFLRLWLLERRTQPEIVVINQRLKEVYETTLKKLDEQRKHSPLKAMLEDDDWVEAYLDLTEQQFWLDPVEGIRYALPFMIAATIYYRSVNADIVKIGKFFEGSLGSPYYDWWQWAKGLNRYLSLETQAVLENLMKLVNQRHIFLSHPLFEYDTELNALLCWRLGDASKVKNKNKSMALSWYEKALAVLPNEAGLKNITASTYWDLANNFEKKKPTERITLLNRAIELKPDYIAAYNSRGIAYSHLKKYQEAIADFDHALKLDPASAWSHLQRGITYRHFQKHKWAMADFNRAIELDPQLDRAYVLRGRAYRRRKEYEEAIADFDRAIALNPNYAWAYGSRSQVYTDIGKYQESIAGLDHAIALAPGFAAINLFSKSTGYRTLRSLPSTRCSNTEQ